MGPSMPFLRDELTMSYTVAGLHVSAFALGMVISGFFGAKIAAQWGRYRVFWVGVAGMALGGFGFSVGIHPAITISSSLFMGLMGSLVLVIIQASLADYHGDRRAIALTESNILASILAAIAPLMVGFGASILFGWRFAIYTGIAFALLSFLLNHSVAFPERKRRRKATKTEPLPAAYWAYWFIVLTSVSIEWSFIFWSADFLENSVLLSRELASTLVSVFLGAVIVGRALGSWLSHSMPISRVLLGAIIAIAIGFPFFWLAQAPWLNILGLFIAGLGSANLYPLTLAAATNAAPTQADQASARISMSAGIAILIAPQILGTLADQVGIQAAFGIVPVLLVGVFIAYTIANQLSSKSSES